MNFALRLFPALLLGCLALPALAQEASEDAPTASETLPLGEPVEPALGSTYVAETHGDWEIRCITVEEGEFEPCQLYQLLTDAEGNAVAEFNVFDVADDDPVVAGATIITPLDTLLTPGLRLAIDESDQTRFPFGFCQQIGCFVRLGLTEDDLSAFRNGGVANVTIVPLPAPDQEVVLEASLSGFTAGFAALEARSPAAAQ